MKELLWTHHGPMQETLEEDVLFWIRVEFQRLIPGRGAFFGNDCCFWFGRRTFSAMIALRTKLLWCFHRLIGINECRSEMASPILMHPNSELLSASGCEDASMAVVWPASSWFVDAVPWKLWTLLSFTSPLLFIAELFSPPTWYSAWHWMPHFRSSACRCFLHCMPRESCRDCSWICFVA